MARCCIALATTCVLALAVSPTARADAALEAALRDKMAAMECPGALVGIFPDAGEPEQYLLGDACRETRQPMTSDLHMRIASVTKLFVGTVVLQLLDEGRLSLDDPISKYVDGVPNGDAITIAQLGYQTSGLFNSIENKDFQAAIVAEPRREWTPAEVLQYAFAKPPNNAPGAVWRYSNTNAVLLGLAIEKIEGKPLGDVVRERICNPLGLHETGFCKIGVPAKPFPAGYRNGYEDKWIGYGSTPYVVTDYSASWTAAAGNMYSTLGDLAKAIKPLVEGKLLGEKGRRALAVWSPTGEDNLEYGFCLAKYGNSIGHMGDVPGYQAVATYEPAAHATLVVLTNLSNNKDGTMPAEQLANIVRRELAGRGHATALTTDEPLADRVKRVEAGLRPFAQAEGADVKWSLSDRMQRYRIPGIAVTVIDDGKIAWSRYYGRRAVNEDAPVESTTRFQAASLSKFVTAIAALHLVEEGRLNLDADVTIGLKSWTWRREDAWKTSPVTLRQLLSHTAGVEPRGYIGYPVGTPLPTPIQILDGLPPANSAAVKVVQQPGTADVYSGGGYQIVERVMSDATGEWLGATAERLVFKPLALSRSTFLQPLSPDDAALAASGHDQGTPLPGGAFVYPELAAAGLWSTSEELATITISIRNALRGQDNRLLTAASAAALIRPAALANDKPSLHGLGPEVAGSDDTLRFAHSGGNVGFRSMFLMYVESGDGAVVMTNDNNGDALAQELIRSIATEYRWPGDDYATKTRKVASMTNQWQGRFVGDYVIDGNNTHIRVSPSDDGLTFGMQYKSPIDLLPMAECSFFATNSDREVTFEPPTEDGQSPGGAVSSENTVLFRFHREATAASSR